MNRLPFRRLIVLLAAFAAITPAARAQVNVSLEIKRPFYIRYEPIVATVRIKNLAGRDLMLTDGAAPWFSFQILKDRNSLLPPRNPNYRLDPLELKIGESLKRKVNLVELYPVTEYGQHKVRAVIYSKELDQYFQSAPVNIQISDGHIIWTQRVGVPETMKNAGATHKLDLLTAQAGDHRYLYARISDESTGTVFCTYRLGHIIDRTEPQVQLDTTNTLHVMQYLGPKTYQLSMIGVNGEMLGKTLYDAPKYKPILKRDSAGVISVAGATAQRSPAATAQAGLPVPKLSDRPPGLPR